MTCDTNQTIQANADLKVNGKKIELNNFVQNFFSETVIGMIKSLRGVDVIETIELKISKKRKDS